VRPANTEVCLLSFDGEAITHICLARQSKMNETARMSLKFTRFVDLQAVKLVELQPWPGLQRLVEKLLGRTVSKIESEDWAGLIAAVKNLRPHHVEALEELEKLRQSVGTQIEHPAFATVAQERDATRLALEIFGLDKEEIRQSLEFEPPVEPAPLLKGLKQVKLREDPMVNHDAAVLPDFTNMRRFIQGSVEFSKDRQRITILNVNRAGVELALGVDLIYYTHAFHAYVMVQYKRLHQVPSDWTFNLNDRQFLEDLRRMDSFDKAFPAAAYSGAPTEYRLHAGHFYFKFCKDVSFEPMSSDMIDGMYLPHDYVRCLMGSPLVEGERGGKVLGYRNSLRHFNNSQFIGIVRGGWVGSRAKTTELLSELVRQSIDADRSVIVGIAEDGE